MRVEEFVGRRVRARREQLGMKQEELGRRVAPLLGKEWSRQTVSMAEQGGRAWTAAELVAVAAVLETRPVLLLTPPIDVTEVEMPGGASLPAHDMIAFGAAPGLLSEAYETLRELQVRLSESVNLGSDALETVGRLADKLAAETMTAVGVISRTRVSQSTGDVEGYDAGSGEWVKREGEK